MAQLTHITSTLVHLLHHALVRSAHVCCSPLTRAYKQSTVCKKGVAGHAPHSRARLRLTLGRFNSAVRSTGKVARRASNENRKRNSTDLDLQLDTQTRRTDLRDSSDDMRGRTQPCPSGNRHRPPLGLLDHDRIVQPASSRSRTGRTTDQLQQSTRSLAG